MPEATPSPTQPVQPVQNPNPVPQPEAPKKTVSILILFLIILILVGLSVGGYFLLTRNKKESTPSTSEKQSCTYNNQTYNDSDSFDATDGCNTCLCNNGTVVCTELDCNAGTNDGDTDGQSDPYEGWNTYNDRDNRLTFRYPPDWTLSESTYNPLGYEVSVTGRSGYSMVFAAAEGNPGVYCIYSDTDTSHMPQDYALGIISKNEFTSYIEFVSDSIPYRRSPTQDQEHEEIICMLDNQTSFFKSYIPSIGIVTYIIPYGDPSTGELATLNDILFSAE